LYRRLARRGYNPLMDNMTTAARIPRPTLATRTLAPLALAVWLAAGCASAAVPGNAAPENAAQGMDAAAAERPLVAAFLVVDGVYNSELMAPYDVLHHTPFHTEPGIEVYVVSPDGEAVTTFEGIVLQPHHGFDDAPPADILVVPSAEGSMTTDLEDERLISWVRQTGEKASWVMSLCDGAFVLAKAGLLDGRAATTFPKDYDEFATLFPDVDLRVNLSFVHDGKYLTSVGGAKSYDVAMYLVDRLYGEKVAQGVGGGLLIPWPPRRQDAPRHAVVTRPAVAADPAPASALPSTGDQKLRQ